MFRSISGMFLRFPTHLGLSGEQKTVVDGWLRELVQIGRKEDFLSEQPGGSYNGHCQHRRTREIGEKLAQLGGSDLMWYAYESVRRKLGRTLSDHLEYAWAGIGGWLS